MCRAAVSPGPVGGSRGGVLGSRVAFRSLARLCHHPQGMGRRIPSASRDTAAPCGARAGNPCASWSSWGCLRHPSRPPDYQKQDSDAGWGMLAGGMSIVTPDTVYGFPYVGYIQSQIGHTMILMGVTYVMIIDKHRPYIRDVPKALFYASILLIFTYLMNYLLGTNYWFLAEKPIGDNITSFMRPEPFHIIDLYIAAIVICYVMYLPYYFKDKSRGVD